MPIYEYTCKSCKMKFEKLVRSMAEQTAICPSCGSKKTERELSVFAVPSESPRGGSMPAKCQSCGDGMCPMRGE